MHGINHYKLTDLPIAVVDLETTGLHPRGDRIIEIAIVRIDPGKEPRLVLETLVNPKRRVSATEIHGITDNDVKDAPTFEELSPVIALHLSGCVFASFNVYFDARFLGSELEQCAIEPFPPHMCLMYLRSVLGLGSRCTLRDACAAHGIQHDHTHSAGNDAIAAAQLWQYYLPYFQRRGIDTYGSMAARVSYKFTQSFGTPLLNAIAMAPPLSRLKSRRPGKSDALTAGPVAAQINPLTEYWAALKSVLADLDVTRAEVEYLARKREDLQLSDDQMRWLHARAFSGVLAQFSDDRAIDAVEADKLALLAGGLRTLGWSPGDPIR